jgi:peptide/nickel transport system substrate-binding protein
MTVSGEHSPKPAPTGLTRRQVVERGVVGSAVLGVSGLVVACGGGGAGAKSSSSTATATATPKRGGTLRAGISGGTSSDTLDGRNIVNTVDGARALNLYNGFGITDLNGIPKRELAEEFTPNADATEWTLRLKQGIEFHNGKTLSAADAIFTLQGFANPANYTSPYFTRVDVKGIKQLDSRTVRIPMKTPYATFADWIMAYGFPVYPVGWDIKNPVGTGPFKFKSFVPGQQSVFVRNPNYWEEGLPYADELVISDFTDETSQINALISGQVDLIDKLSASSISEIQGQGGIVRVVEDSAEWAPIVMRVNAAPFNDVRVRQAMRLIVDREQMRALVYGGHGLLGNDLFSIADPAYDKSLPQREPDIEQAKALLKAAGREGLAIQLVTAPVGAGSIQMAQVFAQQAKAAGVQVSLRQVTSTEMYGPNYTHWVFSQSHWPYSAYLTQVQDSTVPNAPYNETNFADPRYLSMFQEAVATVDAQKRFELEQEMQTIDYDQGGYIIPTYTPGIDAWAADITGVRSSVWYPLGSYGFKWVGRKA